MFRMLIRSGVTRCALTLCVVLFAQTAAPAAFTVSIGGTVVATDNGAGDIDPTAGVIAFAGTVHGYTFDIWSSTGTDGVIHSTVQVIEVARTGNTSVTLEATFGDGLSGGPGTAGLASSLSRGLVNGFDTSGTVKLTTSATSASGGGAGATDVISLAQNDAPSTAGGAFQQTSAIYTLAQTIDIKGLGNNKAVSVTADTERIVHAPAPSAVALVLSGATFLAAFGWFRRPRIKT